MKKLLAVLALAAALVVGAALPAFAHNVQSVGGTVDCRGAYTISGMADWYGGHWLQVDLGGNVVLLNQDNGSNTASKPFTVSGSGGSVGESITTFTLNPNGTLEATGPSNTLKFVESDCNIRVTPVAPKVHRAQLCGFADTLTPATTTGVTYSPSGKVFGPATVTVTATANQGYEFSPGVTTATFGPYTLAGARKCPPHHHKPPTVRKPSASFIGPCGDPYYAAAFNNARSNVSERFTFVYTSFYTRATARISLIVKAGRKAQTAFYHVLGGTLMRVVGQNGHVLAQVRSAPAGDYGPC